MNASSPPLGAAARLAAVPAVVEVPGTLPAAVLSPTSPVQLPKTLITSTPNQCFTLSTELKMLATLDVADALPLVTLPTPVLSSALALPDCAFTFTLLVMVPIELWLMLALASLLTLAALSEPAPVSLTSAESGVTLALSVSRPDVLAPALPGRSMILPIQWPATFTITSTALSPKIEVLARLNKLCVVEAKPLETLPTAELS